MAFKEGPYHVDLVAQQKVLGIVMLVAGVSREIQHASTGNNQNRDGIPTPNRGCLLTPLKGFEYCLALLVFGERIVSVPQTRFTQHSICQSTAPALSRLS